MHRARSKSGRFVSRRRRAHRRRRHNPSRRLFHRRRRSSPRRHVARRRFHRRRRNPAVPGLGGIMPNLMTVAGALAGAAGAKTVKKMVPGLNKATGMLEPLATFATGLGLAFVAKMVPVPMVKRLAGPIALGAAFIAGWDALKLTPFGAQLGSYALPSGYTPVLSSGMGDFPAGFLSAGTDTNYPSGFMAEEDLGFPVY